MIDSPWFVNLKVFYVLHKISLMSSIKCLSLFLFLLFLFAADAIMEAAIDQQIHHEQKVTTNSQKSDTFCSKMTS